jgi:SAM-dependent methyltransferase
VRHDPGYLSRHLENTFFLVPRIGQMRERIRILDYGSGLGRLEAELKRQGFSQVESYDPFTSAKRPSGHFDFITCIEVFEHAPDPVAMMEDIAAFLTPGSGAVLLSTLCCPQSVIDAGLANWWYCVPRNGHISFYTQESLALLAGKHALQYGQLDDYRHLMCHSPTPQWLSGFFRN